MLEDREGAQLFLTASSTAARVFISVCPSVRFSFFYLASRNFFSKLGLSWFLRLLNHRCTCLSEYPVCLQRPTREVWGRDVIFTSRPHTHKLGHCVFQSLCVCVYLCGVFGNVAVVGLQCGVVRGFEPRRLLHPEQRSQRRGHRPAVANKRLLRLKILWFSLSRAT